MPLQRDSRHGEGGHVLFGFVARRGSQCECQIRDEEAPLAHDDARGEEEAFWCPVGPNPVEGTTAIHDQTAGIEGYNFVSLVGGDPQAPLPVKEDSISPVDASSKDNPIRFCQVRSQSPTGRLGAQDLGRERSP